MAKCKSCLTRNASGRSAIVIGVYYSDICDDCFNKSNVVSSGHARWQRSIDVEDHEHEIQQPYNSDGSINTGFAKLYPKQAQALFTSEQLDDANRK